MKRLMAAVVLTTVSAVLGAAPGVSGTWTMSVDGGPHGNATMGLVLKQEGTKVTGTFASGHAADMPVAGEFADGALKIATTGDDDSKIVFSAKLRDDGTLAGYISSPMGDMKWTASRAADKNDKNKDGR